MNEQNADEVKKFNEGFYFLFVHIARSTYASVNRGGGGDRGCEMLLRVYLIWGDILFVFVPQTHNCIHTTTLVLLFVHNNEFEFKKVFLAGGGGCGGGWCYIL